MFSSLPGLFTYTTHIALDSIIIDISVKSWIRQLSHFFLTLCYKWIKFSCSWWACICTVSAAEIINNCMLNPIRYNRLGALHRKSWFVCVQLPIKEFRGSLLFIGDLITEGTLFSKVYNCAFIIAAVSNYFFLWHTTLVFQCDVYLADLFQSCFSFQAR